jgi:hypothetical protein
METIGSMVVMATTFSPAKVVMIGCLATPATIACLEMGEAVLAVSATFQAKIMVMIT